MKRTNHIRHCLPGILGGIGILCAQFVQAAPFMGTDSISLPANTTEGRLSNGLHYLILPNGSPAHTAEFRLIMRLGSAQEADDQLGAAHFLEHMAFAGTRHFPGRSMIEYFESLGMKYGRDINAVTGYDRTVFMLTVPMNPADTRIADSTLLAVKDWLSGIRFEEERTRKERGVILEELRGYDIGDPFYSLKIGQNRFASRMPLGSAEDICRIDRNKLKAFYRQWYTPQLASLVVVGCVDPAQTERSIRKLFGDLPARPVKEYCTYPLTYDGGIRIQEVRDSLPRNSELELIIPHPGVVGKDLTGTCRKEQGRLLVRMLNKRMDLRKMSASVSDNWYLSDKNHFVLSLSGKDKADLLEQLTRLSGELHYVTEEGFCPNEMENGLAGLLESLPEVSDGQTSSQWCEDFTDYVLSGERYIHSAGERERLKELLAQTTSETLQEMLDEWLGFQQQHLLVAYRNNGKGCEKLTEKEVEEAWEAGKRLPVSTFVFHLDQCEVPKQDTPLCLSKAHPFRPEEVLGEKVYPDMKVQEIRLKNGMRILLRPTTDSQKTLYLTAFARGGTADLPARDYHRLEGAAGYMEMGGIAAVDYDTLTAYMSQEEISLNLSIGNHWHELMGMAPAERSQELFNLMFEKMHAPELRYGDFEEIRQEELEGFGKETVLGQMLKRASDRMLSQRLDSLTGSAQTVQIPPRTRKDIEELNLDEMAAYYRSLFTCPAGITLVISGNFEPELVKRQLVATFGRMKVSVPPQQYHNRPFHFPQKTYVEAFPNENETQTLLEYVFGGNYTPSLTETLTLKLVRDVLQARLLQVLREEENIVYSPYVSLFYQGIPQQTYYFDLSASVEVANTERAEALVLQIVSDLQRHPIGREELEHMKRSFLVTKRQVLSDDAPSEWRNTLVNQLKNGESLDDFEQYADCLHRITPERMQQAFRKYLNPQRYILLYQGKHLKYNSSIK